MYSQEVVWEVVPPGSERLFSLRLAQHLLYPIDRQIDFSTNVQIFFGTSSFDHYTYCKSPVNCFIYLPHNDSPQSRHVGSLKAFEAKNLTEMFLFLVWVFGNKGRIHNKTAKSPPCLYKVKTHSQNSITWQQILLEDKKWMVKIDWTWYVKMKNERVTVDE